MARESKLTEQQWAAARRRWEGLDGKEWRGFTWLAREILIAWGVPVHRKSLEQMARAKGWEKGGPPSKELQRDPGTLGQVVALKPAKAPARNIPAAENAGSDAAGNIPSGEPQAERREVASEVVIQAPRARPVGRPSTYKPEYAQLLLDFFDVEPYEDIPVSQANGSIKLQRMARKPPMIGAFAKSIGVSRSAVDDWATAVTDEGKPRYPEFADAYARAREMQEELLAVGGSMGIYEPRFLSMVMKNICGWQDQPQQKIDAGPVSREELDGLFVQRMAAAQERMAAVWAERKALLLGDTGSPSDDSLAVGAAGE